MFDWRGWRDLPWADALMLAAPLAALWLAFRVAGWLMAIYAYGV